jgi:hypothetical protein
MNGSGTVQNFTIPSGHRYTCNTEKCVFWLLWLRYTVYKLVNFWLCSSVTLNDNQIAFFSITSISMTTWYCKVLYGTRSIHIFPHYSNIYNRSTDILPILILVSHSYNRLKSKIITHESVIITKTTSQTLNSVSRIIN